MEGEHQFNLRKWISGCIEDTGWAAIHVFPTADMPNLIPFTYTVGLTSSSLPEIILFGMGARQAHAVIASAIENIDLSMVKEGNSYDEVGNLPVEFRNLPSSAVEEYLCQASSFYTNRSLVRAHQLVWPDAKGRFPWHTDCEPKYATVQSVAVDWRRLN